MPGGGINILWCCAMRGIGVKTRACEEKRLPNVVMTPHCSGWTEGMVERRWGEVAGNINRFVRGKPLENVVITT